MNTLSRITSALDRALAGLLIALTVVIVVTVTWQVITRYLLNSPSSYTEELATYLLLWISLLGAAYALRQRAHLGIDVVTARLTLEGRRRARVASYVVIAVFCLVAMVVGGGILVNMTFELGQRSAALQIPVGYVYLVLPLSGLLMAYYAAVGIVETLQGATPPDDVSGTTEPPDPVLLVD